MDNRVDRLIWLLILLAMPLIVGSCDSLKEPIKRQRFQDGAEVPSAKGRTDNPSNPDKSESVPREILQKNTITPAILSFSNLSNQNTRVELSNMADNFDNNLSNEIIDNDLIDHTEGSLLVQIDSINAKQHKVYEDDHCKLNYTFTFKNHFLCLPCNCTCTLDKYIMAECNSNNTIDEINAALLSETHCLSITKSEMATFNSSNFSKFPYLSSLKITFCMHLVKIIDSQGTHSLTHLRNLDLSHNKITWIEDSSFHNMPNLESINLFSNWIKEVSNLTFEGLYKLRLLNLSGNHLTIIQSSSFEHLVELKVLDLSLNPGLGYSKPFLPEVFSRLRGLQSFDIRGNDQTGKDNPAKIIGSFSNLTFLSIEGIQKNVLLGPEVKTAKQLTSLRITCSRKSKYALKDISKQYFENLPYLQSIKIGQCPLNSIDTFAFAKVKHLKSLELLYSYPYNILKAFCGLKGLQNSSVTSIKFIGLIDSNYSFIFLSQGHGIYMKNLQLEEMNLSENRLAFIGEKFITQLPSTLKKLVLHRNKLIDPHLLLDSLFFLTQLTTVDLGNYFTPHGSSKGSCPDSVRVVPTSYKAVELQQGYTDRDEFDNVIFSTIFNDLLSSDGCENTEGIADPNLTHPLNFFQSQSKIPPNLQYLLATAYLYMNINEVFTLLEQSETKDLIEIDFSYCSLPNLDVERSFPPSVLVAKLDGNYMTHLPCNLFLPGNSLRHLSLSNNLLGEQFAADNGVLFKELGNVTYFDLSMNMIYNLQKNFFMGLKSLQILILKENKLETLASDFSRTPSLWYLELNKNAITAVNVNTRKNLDHIASKQSLYMDLTSNPLGCTCSGLDLLRWIMTSRVIFVSQDFLKCLDDDSISQYVKRIDVRVKRLQRSCVGQAIIIVLCVACLVVICFLVGFGLMYRYRWKLRYLRCSILLRFGGFQPRQSTISVYKFDAFVIYSETVLDFVAGECREELETKRGRKLCFEERDFLPGTLIISNIISAIQNSRKTLLIVTPDFYSEEYSEYAVKMALMEEIYKRKCVLCLCVYKSLPEDTMKKYSDFLMVMKRNDYVEYPPATDATDKIKKLFWDNLSKVLSPEEDEVLPTAQESLPSVEES